MENVAFFPIISTSIIHNACSKSLSVGHGSQYIGSCVTNEIISIMSNAGYISEISTNSQWAEMPATRPPMVWEVMAREMSCR